MEISKNADDAPEHRVENTNLYDIFRKNMDENRSYPLVIFHGKHVSYYNILAIADSLAESLKSTMSIGKGDMVGIALPLSPQFFAAFIALQKIGAVAVPLDPWLTSREFRNVTRVIHLKSLFMPDTSDLLFSKEKAPESAIIVKIQEFLPFEKAVGYSIRNLGNTVDTEILNTRVYRFSDLIYGPRGERVEIDPEKDPAVAMVSTSRNGELQAMFFTSSSLISTASSIAESLPAVKGRFRIGTTLPPFVPSSLQFSVILPILLGGTVTTALERKNYYRLFSLCSLFDSAFILASPYDLQCLIDEGLPNLAIKSLKGVLCNSYLLTDESRDKLAKTYGTHVIEYFGIPEMCGVTHMQSPDRSKEKPGSPGKTLPGTDALILEEKTHKQVSQGATGELFLKGPGMAISFSPQPSKDEDLYLDGYFDTGDIASVDENGLFFVEERRRDAIHSEGILVSSREIEEVISEVQGVNEAAVIGIGNKGGDEEIVAVISAESEDRSLISRITKTCRNELSTYKIPARIEFRKELPKSMSGIILKSQLLEDYSGKQ